VEGSYILERSIRKKDRVREFILAMREKFMKEAFIIIKKMGLEFSSIRTIICI
jgi:hypothetical protein